MDPKKLLRKEITTLLKQKLTEEQLVDESRRVAQHALELFKSLRQRRLKIDRVALFLSMPSGEIRTDELIEMMQSEPNVTVYVPLLTSSSDDGDKTSATPRETVMKFVALRKGERPDEFEKDKWQIPVVPEVESREFGTGANLDLVFTPGLAFDPLTFHRLGRGKGYYDRTFKRLERERVEAGGGSSGVAIIRYGLALSPQIVDRVPFGEFDVPLDGIVHPGGIIHNEQSLKRLGAGVAR